LALQIRSVVAMQMLVGCFATLLDWQLVMLQDRTAVLGVWDSIHDRTNSCQ
jgi:hypothetical protein